MLTNPQAQVQLPYSSGLPYSILHHVFAFTKGSSIASDTVLCQKGTPECLEDTTDSQACPFLHLNVIKGSPRIGNPRSTDNRTHNPFAGIP